MAIRAHQALVTEAVVGRPGQKPGNNGDGAGSVDVAAKKRCDDALGRLRTKQKDDDTDVGGHRGPEDHGGGQRDRNSPGEAASAQDKKEKRPERRSRAQEAQPIGRIPEAGKGDSNQDEVVQRDVDHVTNLRCRTEHQHRKDNHNEMEAKKEADKSAGP